MGMRAGQRSSNVNKPLGSFGRAVSRILSSRQKCRGENHLSQQPVPGTRSAVRNRNGQFQGPLFGLAPDGVFRASALTLGAVGSYPAFSPLPPIPSQRPGADGGLFSVALSVGTSYGVVSRVYLANSACDLTSYAASRPMVFGLSSPIAENRDGSDSPPFQNREEYTVSESVNQAKGRR
jgi:hypothetical protein